MNNIVLIIFSIVMLAFIFYGGMTVYSLLRFGQSRILGTFVSTIFAVLVIILAINAFINLAAL